MYVNVTAPEAVDEKVYALGDAFLTFKVPFVLRLPPKGMLPIYPAPVIIIVGILLFNVPEKKLLPLAVLVVFRIVTVKLYTLPYLYPFALTSVPVAGVMFGVHSSTTGKLPPPLPVRSKLLDMPKASDNEVDNCPNSISS